jgi:acyl-homoserine-lactone acylase
MLLADRMLPDLLAEARRRGDGDARRAADVLEQWDRSAEATSRGAVLFQRWAMTWLRAGGPRAFARPWRLDSALTTPAGLADPAVAVAALSAAARDTEKEHGSLDVPWGEVMRIRYGGRDLPGNGAPGDPLGVFRVAYYAPETDGKYRLLAGDTYYQVVEFSKPVRAKVLLAYGNATQPGSKHVGDQLDLFDAKSMRDAWTSRADVEAHLELREALDSLRAPKGEARPAGR